VLFRLRPKDQREATRKMEEVTKRKRWHLKRLHGREGF
jgi:hypothetical protein